MEVTQEEIKIIDKKLAKADEDMKNGQFYTEEEFWKLINQTKEYKLYIE